MRTVLGKAEYNEIVRDKREALMAEIKTLMNEEMRKSDTGVEVVDVRIRHADLPKANTKPSSSVCAASASARLRNIAPKAARKRSVSEQRPIRR